MNIPSIGQLFQKRMKENPDKNVIGTIENEQINFIDFKTYFSNVEKTSFAFKELGLNKGDKVGILATTRCEWHFADLASVLSGLVTVPVYPTYSSEDIFYILEHAEVKLLFVENDELYSKVHKLASKLPNLKVIVSFDPLSAETEKTEDAKIISYSSVLDTTSTPKGHLDQSIESLDTSAPASIIYTSGTTGVPKGALITSDALAQALENTRKHFYGAFTSEDRTLTWLPLSHVFGRFESFLPIAFNWEMVFAENMEKLIQNISLAKPTIMVSVPRIFEKIHAKVMAQIESSSIIKKQLFSIGNSLSNDFFDSLDKDISPSPTNFFLRKLFYKLVFSKIYNRFGGKIRLFISGGAPLSPSIIKFLRNCNLTVLEGYGLTESVAASFCNLPSRQIPGTVGLPIGDVEIKFDTDGEILIKSKALFSGYYKNPEETEKAMSGEWFRTGDIGELDSRGFLKITDRKKDIIVTAGGKNVAPQKIENRIKAKHLISQCVILGDKQRYLTALIGLEMEDFAAELDNYGLKQGCSYPELCNNDQVKSKIQAIINEINKDLSQFETVKYFYLVPEEFSVDSGLLTPSLKVKKKHIMEKYKNEIDSMYH
jgi:long-chain acyl-CoA synthetase